MSIKDFMSDNLPTFLSIGACAGVIGTGYLAMETGREIERKSEKKSILKKAVPTVLCGVGTIVLTLTADKLNRDKIALTKKELAEATAALGAVTKIFREYRKHVDPEEDKQIMNDIALKGVRENVKYEKPEEAEYDENGNVIQRWTDPWIKYLSDGKYTYYKASEADVLAASNYLINHYCSDCEAYLGQFYDSLRKRGVDIPKFKGENGITWEMTSERLDYYGRGGLDFSYSDDYTIDGIQVNIIFFDDDDEVIREFDRKLKGEE